MDWMAFSLGIGFITTTECILIMVLLVIMAWRNTRK